MSSTKSGDCHEAIVVGLVGSGPMAVGIADVVSASGFQVIWYDLDSSLKPGRTDGPRGLADKCSAPTLEVATGERKSLHHIRMASDYAELSPCLIIIEAAHENEILKLDIYKHLQNYHHRNSILITAGSSISVTRLASYSANPERFMGLNFIAPEEQFQVIEIVRGIATSDEAYNQTLQFLQKLRINLVNAKDFPLFIFNRVLLSMINEAAYVLYEGVGTVLSIDIAIRLGLNQPSGPLELADRIGLDTCLENIQRLHTELADEKYRACPLLVKYVEAGWLGAKTGRGFYDYRTSPAIPTR